MERVAFDSELLGLEIGRIVSARAGSEDAHRRLLAELSVLARDAGYRQVLRRTPLDRTDEVRALEQAGYRLMDVGLTFRTRPSSDAARGDPRVSVRPSVDADLDALVAPMVQRPWGSRYEADPEYPPDRVRDLLARWIVNSHRGRADAMFVAVVGSEPAGFVTCVLDVEGSGRIELIGTMPGFRRRGIGRRLLRHAEAWFAGRVPVMRVRTQATNAGAIRLYETSGLAFDQADATFRRSLGEP
jgi:ribosomal protein S18 acetylase RimI-like enzyme